MIHAQHVFLQLTGTLCTETGRSFCRTTILGIVLADVTITNYRILSYMKCA